MPAARVVGAIVMIVFLAACRAGAPIPTAPIAYAPADDTNAVGLVGSAIGLGIVDGDRKAGLNAEYRALERGKAGIAVEWRGRTSAGMVVPGPPYRINDYDCRRFTHTVSKGETTESATATACRTPEGVWRLVG